MIEVIDVDCRKCENVDFENDCCTLYGKDPDVAVRRCIRDRWVNYNPVREVAHENS